MPLRSKLVEWWMSERAAVLHSFFDRFPMFVEDFELLSSRSEAPDRELIDVYSVPNISWRCWACGRMAETERCHIVPRSRGGSEECSNLVLLCKSCHHDAPSVSHSQEEAESSMFCWIRARETQVAARMRTVEDALRGAEDLIAVPDLANALREKMLARLHGSQLHGGVLANSTISACIRGAVQELSKEKK